MSVARWETSATFFPWPYDQQYIQRTDSTVYHHAVSGAQEMLIAEASPCPQCGQPAKDLSWFSVSDPEVDWDAGIGRVGWLTICERCRLQVDFLLDQEMTDMQTEQWRDSRTLS